MRFAGLLVWERAPKEMGAKTPEERAKDADRFLESYTCWCNGEGYGFSVDEEITLPCGHVERTLIDSCFGYFGNDLAYMASLIKNAIGADKEVKIEGDASFLDLDLGVSP